MVKFSHFRNGFNITDVCAGAFYAIYKYHWTSFLVIFVELVQYHITVKLRLLLCFRYFSP